MGKEIREVFFNENSGQNIKIMIEEKTNKTKNY